MTRGIIAVVLVLHGCGGLGGRLRRAVAGGAIAGGTVVVVARGYNGTLVAVWSVRNTNVIRGSVAVATASVISAVWIRVLKAKKRIPQWIYKKTVNGSSRIANSIIYFLLLFFMSEMLGAFGSKRKKWNYKRITHAKTKKNTPLVEVVVIVGR